MKSNYWLFLILGLVIFCLLDGEPSQPANPEDIKNALVELKDDPFFRALLVPVVAIAVYFITTFFLRQSNKQKSETE
jgi:hypothetical protein